MITCILCMAALFAAPALFCQSPKGLKPAVQQKFHNGRTRALVVGISNYQFIDKLDYADRDAEMFADWLANYSSWNIVKSDITLLTNEQAKRGDLIAQIQRLATLSKAGDNLVFYFSGHGDIETLTKFQNGYLLTYDTYSNNYMAGALSVKDLKDIFVSLTLDTVNVIVVTDACRSGNLAGGIDGARFTASALQPLWNNEIKILSSQPGQLSQEGKKWGDGRGVFSYYLINGLRGEADANKDSLIMLSELEQYVGNIVSKATDNQQQPIFEGPNKYSTVITRIKKDASPSTGKKTGNSSLPLKRLQIPEDSCVVYQRQLSLAISEKRFDRKDAGSAMVQYQKLRSCSPDKDLVLGANSQLLSALMNTAQEIVNNSFIGKNFVKEHEYAYAIDLFDQVAQYNDLRLPYEEQLVNLKRYLKVLGTTIWGDYRQLPTLEPILDSAIQQEPDAAYLLSAKGILELRNMNYTKAIQILEKATAKSPGWLIPKYYLGIAYGYKKDYRKALDYYREVLKKDSLYRTFDCAKCIQEQMAEFERKLKRIRFDKYPADLKERASLDSARNELVDNIDSAYFYHNLGKRYDKKNHPHQDSVYFFYTQAVELDPWEPEYMYTLIRYLRKKSYGEAEIRDWLKKSGEYEDNDKRWFAEDLMLSYIYSKEYENALRVAIKLHDEGLYSCNKMRKLNKKLQSLPGFIDFMKENCQE